MQKLSNLICYYFWFCLPCVAPAVLDLLQPQPSIFFSIAHITKFIFASKSNFCLGLGGDCCIATVAKETVNHDLWPYTRNNVNGKLHTNAILGIQQCSFSHSGHCFMAYRVGFIQPFSLMIHRGERCDIAESFSPYLLLYTWFSTALLAMIGSLYVYYLCIPHLLLWTLLKISQMSPVFVSRKISPWSWVLRIKTEGCVMKTLLSLRTKSK